ncbi:MAG: hypothetical protein JWR70_2578 [Modestobacter sp.]|nr:hypothetical protein [Modestobacter sp.]
MDALQPRPATSWTELVFSRAQARAAGRTEEEIRALLTSGRWTALRRGQYCVTADLEAATDARRFHLELLALQRHLDRPTAAASHTTAARLHGLEVARPTADVHRLTDPDRWRAGRGYRMTRAALRPDDVTRLGPINVTRVARTLVDCARECSEIDAVAAMDDALLREEVTPTQLRAVLDQAPFTRGMPAARRALAQADGRAESWLESAWRVRHLAAGLPRPGLQVEEIWIGSRLVKVVDGWLPDHAIAFECDGKVKYTDPYRGRDPAEVLWREKRAEDLMRSVGIRVVRVVTSDVFSGWPALAARTRRELVSPVPALRAFRAVPRVAGRVRPRRDRSMSRADGG